MSIQLRKEQNEYIDKILSKGLNEIVNIPSFDISIISNSSNSFQNDYNNFQLKNNSMKINQLNLKIPTSSDFDIYNEIINNKVYNNKIILPNNNNEEKKEDFFNSVNNNKFNNLFNKYNFEINSNNNYKIRQKTFSNKEEIKENKKNLMMQYNIPNNREIIENALWNNQKNINKLNKQITGNTLSSSQGNNNKNKADLSTSTLNLLDKYNDLKSSISIKNDSSINELKDSILIKQSNNNLTSNNDNNNMLNIHDLSCINQKNKKYNPKSSALKKLIDKLKKEEEYEESRNRNNKDLSKNNYISNSNSIQVSSFGDSELFTLGNSNITSSTEKSKIKLEPKYKKPKIKQYKNHHKKLKYKSELNSDALRTKNIRTFDKISVSGNKYNNINSEMNIIRDRIKKISQHLKLEDSSKIDLYIPKNYSMKSLLKSNYKMKKPYFNISSVLSMENISHIKDKKGRCNSMNINMSHKYIKLMTEEKDYMRKYEELRIKFEEQRKKMKKEKDIVVMLQQKIKMLQKKFEKYPELVEFNKTLNEQNFILIKNLNFSDDVRKKQAKLIEVLQNQIKKIKKI